MDKPKEKLARKIVRISINTIFYIVIALLLVFSLANIQVKKENDIANVFGRGFLSVQSESMSGDLEDNFEKGDIIFVKMLNDESREDLEIGDIVTYYDLSIRAFNTHRIIEIYENDGETYLITRGDNTPGQDQPIRVTDAISLYQSKWSGAGSALDYLQSPTGFALFVILPVIIILVFEGVVLVRNVLALNKSKMEEKYALEKEQTIVDLEAEKEKMRAQIMEELKKNKESEQ
ncbi:MAG: signal peptidase I [Tenericutes bacterium HGW-Tenericutes-3]|nr:MAG: signal peptidase I [Tenericutes bacterium HGW-Tenericutes-3]